uniref:uncharacterized protein LOC122608529 isoform X1 n=1 Tax=Erigeron canadensis TaxID=72917 RepID=UPI001CB89235|nr:uncharacterized protein LOC122608529 isoform X1 [Erigeron canadensis]XP_043637576.1 uncharacterized protein LOC122608529 isoform X1 [Erigeron canadensis]XP_043637581.1 uncharacterized protein LOC122608529 isoform X1 [Erigeron canadensis]
MWTVCRLGYYKIDFVCGGVYCHQQNDGVIMHGKSSTSWSVQNGSHKNPVCKILRLLYLPRLNRHVASPGDSPKIDGIHLHNLRMCWSTPPTSHVDMWKWQCFYTNRLLKHTHT